MKYIDIQNEIIKKYGVRISAGCPLGCRVRTHAHPRLRQVCKWKPSSSLPSTFTLLHEVGHIETDRAGMRRAEQEYHATVWALERCKEYGLEVPSALIGKYQKYIDQEKARGLRRGGKGYAELKLEV
ncbi:MAG: hypothetical protein IKY65_04615 [Rikenellaceae bacterium]|nr:hypothetical protein [Rikenellaceae bacterium]